MAPAPFFFFFAKFLIQFTEISREQPNLYEWVKSWTAIASNLINFSLFCVCACVSGGNFFQLFRVFRVFNSLRELLVMLFIFPTTLLQSLIFHFFNKIFRLPDEDMEKWKKD